MKNRFYEKVKNKGKVRFIKERFQKIAKTKGRNIYSWRTNQGKTSKEPGKM